MKKLSEKKFGKNFFLKKNLSKKKLGKKNYSKKNLSKFCEKKYRKKIC